MLDSIFKNSSLKPKEKTEQISQALLDKKISTSELIEYAQESKDSVKATCMEALEYLTKQHPAMVDEAVFLFAIQSLSSKAPRVKWESARVIGNLAPFFEKHFSEAIPLLLENAKHPGTVVRWSTAFALGEILKLKTPHSQKLLPLLQEIKVQEEKNSIQKIYSKAIASVEK